jgi:uncharacterized protein YecE (DUF72 family)
MRRTIRRGAASGEKQPPVLHVGCSGWQYRHWRGEFYPNAVPASRWLEYYASHFDTVEINNSFYRLPTAATFATWRDRVPPGFVYAVKASRYITHLKKLKDPADPLERLFSRAVKLRGTLGPVLYQLPPGWPLNLGRLRKFLGALPKRRRHAVEFRDPSWYVEEVFASLRDHRVAMCVHDMADLSSGLKMVGPFVYARFHGPSKYRGAYSEERLQECAAWCAARLNEGIRVYAYFNNDIGGHAPRDATRFRAMTVAALGSRFALS